MRQLSSRQKRQSGVMLIEALLAMLIFSIGVLGIIGMQSAATQMSSDAKFRGDAALLANELVSRMLVSNRSQANLQAVFASPNGTEYMKWAYQGYVTGAPGTQTAPASGSVLAMLPQASLPLVKIEKPGGQTINDTSTKVTITIFWQEPGTTATHNYIANALIGG